MSIFSSLFSSKESSPEPEEKKSGTGGYTEERQQPESAPTGELCHGMRLDVIVKEGEAPLLTGRITSLTDSALTLERLPGALSFKTCSIGADVRLNGYDRKLIPVTLSATVEESSRTVFKVKNVRVETYAENRDTFRLPISAPVSLYRQDDEHLRRPEECQLVDISTGGACIQSEYIHAEDEVLRIRVKLDDYAPLNFLGQIVRCVEYAPGQYRYGFLFAQLTEMEIAALNKTLFNLQMGIKETHMRTESGDWGSNTRRR